MIVAGDCAVFPHSDRRTSARAFVYPPVSSVECEHEQNGLKSVHTLATRTHSSFQLVHSARIRKLDNCSYAEMGLSQREYTLLGGCRQTELPG